MRTTTRLRPHITASGRALLCQGGQSECVLHTVELYILSCMALAQLLSEKMGAVIHLNLKASRLGFVESCSIVRGVSKA